MAEDNKKESENANSNNIIKLIMVGDSGTGKTNLISVAAGLEFNTSSLTTTSCSYVQKIITFIGISLGSLPFTLSIIYAYLTKSEKISNIILCKSLSNIRYITRIQILFSRTKISISHNHSTNNNQSTSNKF